jgi:hypothetical protein
MAGKSYIKTNTYNWSKIRKMYVKTGATTWTAIRKAYLKTGTFAWRKVFDTSSNRPFIVGNDIPKIRINSPRTDSPLSGAVNPFIEAPPVQYVGPRSNNVKGATETPPYEGYPADGFGDYLWGYDGTWSPSSGVTFTRSWYWNNTGNNNDNQGDINPSSDDRDDKLKNAKSYLEFPMSYSILGTYLYFKVRGSNSSGPTDAVSAPVRLIRQEPEGTLSISTPASVPLNQPKTVTLTALNRWYDAPDQDESTLNWYSELSVSSPLLNSSTLVKSSRLIDIVPVSLEDGDGTAINETDSYIPVNVNSKGYSDADRYLFAVLTLKNSGTYYTGQTVSYTVNTTVPVGQTRSYTPQWNEYIKVSTNGYIGLGNASNISAVNDTSTIGHVVSFLNKDLKQIHLKYYSDSTKYIVDYAGKLYDVTSDTITYRYQAHFYPGQNYVDFYVINNAGGTSANAYLYDGDQQVAWGASKPAGDAYRIYLTSGVPFGTIAYNPRSTTTGFTNVTTNNQVDDGETSLQLLQGISAPENLQRPIFQLIFGTANKVGSTYRLPSGSWTNSPTEYNYYLVKNDINGTEVANSGWTTATYFDYTFTAATSQSVAGYVYARNSGGESFPAISTESIGPFTVLEATAPTSVTAANNGSTDTITVSWSGSTNATRYRIYWNSNGIVPGSADAYYDEEKIVNNTTITSSSGFWAWGPADPDRNSNLPAGRIAQYFMVSASSDGVTWTPYVVTSTATGVVLPVPVNTAVPTLTPTGAYSAGDTLTFGVGSWSNTPTSYSLRLYRGTQFVATSETLVKDAGNVTSSTYTIPASDYDGTGRYYYRAFATATNSGGTSNSGVYTAGAEGGPLAQPLSSPTPTSVSYSHSVFTVNFTGGSGPAYQVWYQAGNAVLFGTDAGTGDAQGTSSPITKTLGGTEGTTYYWWVRSAKTTTSSGTGNVSAWSGPVSVTIPITPRVPTITMQANTGVTTTAGTINWTSTNQASFSSNGTFSGTGTTGTSISKTGLTASTAYTGTVTVTSSTGHTAQANYSLTTSAPAATYTITYNGNGNTGGSTASQTGNGTITLRSNGFTRTNCTFQGWATSSAGAVSYPAGFSYNLTANVTLYAVWAAAANSANAPVVTFLGNSPGANTKRWSWTGGAVTGGTATGWQYAISSTSGTSGFGAFTATTTASLSLTVTNAASNPRWLKVRRTYTDGLGVAKVGPTNDPGV